MCVYGGGRITECWWQEERLLNSLKSPQIASGIPCHLNLMLTPLLRWLSVSIFPAHGPAEVVLKSSSNVDTTVKDPVVGCLLHQWRLS